MQHRSSPLLTLGRVYYGFGEVLTFSSWFFLFAFWSLVHVGKMEHLITTAFTALTITIKGRTHATLGNDLHLGKVRCRSRHREGEVMGACCPPLFCTNYRCSSNGPRLILGSSTSQRVGNEKQTQCAEKDMWFCRVCLFFAFPRTPTASDALRCTCTAHLASYAAVQRDELQLPFSPIFFFMRHKHSVEFHSRLFIQSNPDMYHSKGVGKYFDISDDRRNCSLIYTARISCTCTHDFMVIICTFDIAENSRYLWIICSHYLYL